jgi:hypothetical protein
MRNEINIYCDESCHLPNDDKSYMILGAVWCDKSRVREVSTRIREIKIKNGLSGYFEYKWTKASPAKLRAYMDVIDYFFDDDDLHFRGLVASKANLDHDSFGQDHDTWYYKMYFQLLKNLIPSDGVCYIYLDIKDTKSQSKVEKLHTVLCNNEYDFNHSIIKRIQHVRSHEVEQLQLTDLLIGALSAVNNKDVTSNAKLTLVERIRQRSGFKLNRSTLLSESKFNIFVWNPRGHSNG